MQTIFKLIISLFIFGINPLHAQQLTQTIRGKVMDEITKNPMPGATVMVLNTDPLNGTTTNSQGEFKIPNVNLGNQTLRVSFIGYKDLVISNILVNSGKEVILEVALEEDITHIQEFVVTANEKDRTINEMIGVSGRTFSVEETRKFAAAVNDPARMAASFSGVVSTDDGNNNISIRGNNPNGLLWRMEGIDIPNPNHFVNPGSSGGGISILSSQLLANSDFLTGAFPAEYGNALSGVFDLNLRKGNNEQREFTIQAGLLGTDIAAEGPFSKNYKGSYLINYRYSTLSLISQLGVPIGDFVTNFQDLSFNFYLPTGARSSLSVFGFGGLSDQKGEPETDSLLWESDGDRYGSNYFSNTGAIGIKYNNSLSKSNFLQTTILASGNGVGDKGFRLTDSYEKEERYFENFSNSKITFSSVLNTKLSARASLRSGVYLNQLYYKLRQDSFEETKGGIQQKINSTGNTQSIQAFSQIHLKASEQFTVTAGLHYLQLLLNDSKSIEPRISASYQVDEKQRLSLGYGLHSQIQPLGTYFAEQKVNGLITLPNKNLGLSKSQHLVLGYDRSLNPFLRLKAETYYQQLFNVPIKAGEQETFSIINQEWSFATDPLINEGSGKNYGVEFTLEQFTHKGLYFLLSTSFYNSLYKTQEEVWRNTRFNGNMNLTLTAGKEYTLKKDRTMGVNIRSIYSGGLRTTPINLVASKEAGKTIYFEEQAFETQNPGYFRTDLRVSLKRNKPKSTRTWALDLQNSTNRKNIFGSFYDPLENEVITYNQSPLIPILSYRVEF